MGITILFEGKQYDSVDAMPDDVREMYRRTMAMFVDNDANGIPDILEGKAAQQLPGVAHSTVVNISGGWGPPSGTAPLPSTVSALDSAARTMAALGLVTVVLGGIGVLVIGVMAFLKMDSGSRSQGGSLYVSIGIILALGWLGGVGAGFARRLRR